MNWKRGFHRLFLVLAALWIAFAIFITADQLDGHLYFRQSALQGQVAMEGKALASEAQPSKQVQPVALTTDELDTFIAEHMKRDRMAADIPQSTLSPRRFVIADYTDDGQKIVLPRGYKLDAPLATRRVNLAGVGVVQFPGELDDARITEILGRNFGRPKKYDIFDIVDAEHQGRATLLDQKQNELAAVSEARLFRHRVAGIFDTEHRANTLAVMLLPPVVIYALFAGAFLALRWIARGFRSSAVTRADSEQKGPTS
jgi:hypothetical protein